MKMRTMIKAISRRSLKLAVFVGLATLAIGPLAFSTSGNRIKTFFTSQATRRVATKATSQQTPDSRSVITAETISQIVALESEKSSRTPSEQKIGSQLLQAVRASRGQSMAAGVNLAAVDTKADSTGKFLVDIDAKVTDALVNDLETIGVTVIYPSFEYNTIRAKVDLSQVETIAGMADVKFIQMAIRSMTSGMAGLRRSAELNSISATDLTGQVISPNHSTSGIARPSFAERAARVREQLTKALAKPAFASPYFTGSVDSEGDRTHRADDLRNTFGYSGAGVRIGVLSDSFNNQGGAAADIASGDLPGVGNPLGNTTPVTIVQDLPGNSGSDEGRAMMQIVHDIAPKAQLFFATADISEAGFASNILALRNAPNNCDIIIDDVFYFDESPFQDGIIAQAVNTVTAGGALYFSSAGNEGNVAKNTAGYFEGDFDDTGSPAFTFPGGAKTGTIHNFSGTNGDIITSVGEAYTLNWADPAGASSNDYDLFLVSSGGTVKASSTNIQNGTQNPFEIINPPVLAAGDRLVVFKTNASASIAFAINTLRGTLTINTTGQTHGHSAAVNAFSVAATPAAAAFNGVAPVGPFPGAFVGTNNVEPFTSDGPRRVFFNANGTAITPGNFKFGTNGGTVRSKPDITGADGVSTTLPGASGLNPFYGTSAAAPHAGAIAGLLLSGNHSLTPAQIRTILTTTALDIETAGNDNLSGFGIVQAFQAMQAVSPTPQADVNLGTVTTTDGTFSNHNGVIDPGENGNVVVQLTNPSLVAATNVSATLSTSTVGVTVDTATANYGTIAASGSATNGGSPFQISVSNLVPCGTVINFTLTVTFTGPNSPQVFLFNVIVGSQPPALNGTLGTAPPTAPGVTSTSGTQTGRLTRNGVQSACGSAKPNPGLTAATGSRQFDAYTFTNTNATDQCVTVTMTSANGVNLYTVAYNNAGFVPSNPSTNYLADPGTSSNTQTYSFTAPAGQAFTVVVHDINVLPTSGSSYTLTVGLSTCAAGPVCTPVTITTASIASGSTGTPYNQSFAATGGSGNYVFSESGTLPNGIMLVGNALTGTPTQAGSFPISITATDAAGCPPDTKNYTLVIAGDAPASITATSGTPQSAPPNLPFANPLVATVRDGANAPLAGVTVTFTAPGAGASGTFPGNSATATVVTDGSGNATAPTFTANSTAGSYTVTASVVALAPANFSLTNACPGTATVTTTTDSGAGSLRQVVADIMTSQCNTTVNFAVTGTIALTSGEIPITNNIVINGPGAKVLTVSGSNLSRIFNINAGAAAVSISGLTLRDGKPSGGTTGGGAILINNGASVGAVNLTDLVITNNDASLAGNPLGGGIDNEGGVVTITRCSIVNNNSTFRGAGIQNQGFGSMVIDSSTIAGNSASATGIGGGIRSLLNLTLTNDTIFGNSAQTAGNVSRSGGTLTFQNTIVAGGTLLGSGGTSPDLNGTVTSNDFNLIQDTTGATIGGTTTHNITGVSPNLLPLGNYGGSEPTLLPAPTSPVINVGDTSLVSGTDQRGLQRVVGGQADIGSVETNYVLTATAGTPQSAGLLSNFATALKANLKESGVNFAGATVTFTAPGAGASGLFGGSTNASVVTDVNGNATAPTFTANSTAGSYTVIASVGPAITNASFSLTNTKATTTTAVVSSVNPSVFGQSVTFTATVTPGTNGLGLPTGTVTFTVDGSNVATVGLNGSAQATFTTNALSVGPHTVFVTYNGDATFQTSTSSNLNQTVNKAQSSTQVSSSINPSTFGQAVTFTVIVSAVPPGAGTPTGTVQFKDGANNLGAPVTLVAGGGNLSTAVLTAGTHTITAVYSGDGNFLTSTSLGATQTVNKAGTTTTITSSANPSQFGQQVTFTATIAAVPPGAGTPTGTVTFTDGATTLGTGTLNGAGQATFATVALSVGTHSIVASYGGDANFLSSASSTLTQTVNKAQTTTALTSSVNPSVFGQSVTFTATVTSAAPAAIAPPAAVGNRRVSTKITASSSVRPSVGAGTPTGTVTFMDGATVLGTGTLNGSAVATFTISALAVGSHPITAVYGGDGNFLTSTSPTVNQVVNKANTTTTLSSSANPSVFGQSVTITATVAAVLPGAGTPTGTVTFFDGATQLGTGTLNGSGVATFTTSAFAVGSHSLTASYGGDGSFNGSTTASALTQVVNKAATNTVLTTNAAPEFPGGPQVAFVGGSVTITATIVPIAPGAGTPTGTVQFKDNGVNLGGPVALVAGKASVTETKLTPGTHVVTASYSGDGNFLASNGTLSGGLIVGFQFKDNSNGNVLIVTVPANGVSGNGTYTFISNGTVIVSNVTALIEFNQNVLRIRTNSPSFNAVFDATTQVGQAILFDTTRNQSFIINSSNFVLVP